LLLVPGECNFSGMKANLPDIGEMVCDADRMNSLISNGRVVKNHNKLNRLEPTSPWLWMLDASKLAATSRLSLGRLQPTQRPHFVAVSFYKIFGYPTGIGALLVRKDIKHLLHKTYYGGGTVSAISALDDYVAGRPRDDLGSSFEDGTPNFHGISGDVY